MIFTGDGSLIYKIQRKEFHVEKEYELSTDRELSRGWLDKLQRGWKLADKALLPCKIEKIGVNRYKVILTEGKKRQIRLMFKAAGVKVERLVRVRIGNITLKGLKEGELRKLSDEEAANLKRLTL
jgi:pseudouridine synthase